jgi:GntR family transcriptional regulator / MocR family aminotransferase
MIAVFMGSPDEERGEYLRGPSGGKGPLGGGSPEPLGDDRRARAPLEDLAALGVSLELDRSEASAPLHVQVAARVRDAIESGRLAAGVRLPSSRTLARALGVSRTVVASAYADLTRGRLISARHGSGTFVLAPSERPIGRPRPTGPTRWLPDGAEPAGRRDAASGSIDLRLRGGSFDPLPREVWRQAWRHAAAELPPTYDDPRGDQLLREGIAAFVTRVRGVPCTADDVVVTAGASDALDLLMKAAFVPGDVLGVEEPGYPGLGRLAAANRVEQLRIPVDERGVDVSALERSPRPPLAMHVTASHQFPLGIELILERRERLLAWARATGGLVIENDYDGEFRFSERVQPPLAALDDHGSVAFVGTFSRVLAPALRVGYVVATRALAERIGEVNRQTDHYASYPTQRAVAELIRQGHLERHLRRVRSMAEYKRSRIQAALDSWGDAVGATGLHGGLHLLLEPRNGVEPARVVELAARRGVLVERLAPFYTGVAERDGILLDYSSASVQELERALATVGELLGA